MPNPDEDLIDPADMELTSEELWEKAKQTIESLANHQAADVPCGGLQPIKGPVI